MIKRFETFLVAFCFFFVLKTNQVVNLQDSGQVEKSFSFKTLFFLNFPLK